MFVRLAFSTAIHFNPDVLMIDEVLAVGDSRFQQKCLDRLNAFRKAGKTLVLVSHNTDQVKSLCDEVLVLEEGKIVTLSHPKSAIECYHDLMRQRSERRATQLSGGSLPNLEVERGSRLGTHEAIIDAVHFSDEQGRVTDTFMSDEGVNILLHYGMRNSLSDMALILGIYSETNVKCFETTIDSTLATFGDLSAEGKLSCHLPGLPLLAGRYYVDIGLYPTDWSYVYDYHWHMHVLHIESRDGVLPGVSGVVSVKPIWSVQKQ
jgi:lipopolysaccharide transport system ATP-binding protein